MPDGKCFHMACLKCANEQCESRKTHDENMLYGQSDDGTPYCYACIVELFAERCVKCREPITSSMLQAIDDQTWHMDCFRCVKCDAAVGKTKWTVAPEYSETNPTCLQCNAWLAELLEQEEVGSPPPVTGGGDPTDDITKRQPSSRRRRLRRTDYNHNSSDDERSVTDGAEDAGSASHVDASGALRRLSMEEKDPARGEFLSTTRKIPHTRNPDFFGICANSLCANKLGDEVPAYTSDEDRQHYCEPCSLRPPPKPCSGCGHLIFVIDPGSDAHFFVDGSHWHLRCFRCAECEAPLSVPVSQADEDWYFASCAARTFDCRTKTDMEAKLGATSICSGVKNHGKRRGRSDTEKEELAERPPHLVHDYQLCELVSESQPVCVKCVVAAHSKLVRRDPANAKAQRELGLLLLERGRDLDVVQAARCLRAAVDSEDAEAADWKAHVGLAQGLLQLPCPQTDEARDMLEQARVKVAASLKDGGCAAARAGAGAQLPSEQVWSAELEAIAGAFVLLGKATMQEGEGGHSAQSRALALLDFQAAFDIDPSYAEAHSALWELESGNAGPRGSGEAQERHALAQEEARWWGGSQGARAHQGTHRGSERHPQLLQY
jgi:hypothetical protein